MVFATEYGGGFARGWVLQASNGLGEKEVGLLGSMVGKEKMMFLENALHMRRNGLSMRNKMS